MANAQEDDCPSLVDREDEPPPLLEPDDSGSDTSDDEGGIRNRRHVVPIVHYRREEVQQGVAHLHNLRVPVSALAQSSFFSNGRVYLGRDNYFINVTTSGLHRYVARYVARVDEENI